MANVRLANASQQAAMDAVVDLIDGGASAGTIQIRSGTQPADANSAATGTLLATLTFSDPAFGATNTSGVATASAITDDTSADATGTAAWARVLDSNSNVIFDCDVGTSGATINLNTTSITAGGTVSITSFTMTHPDGT
ncbi:MAG: hypothetical protein N0C84_05845 [Candidatus Thiodiazotropha taylori]|uniref:Uncharacterized protein n=1 Tax=Candidatus Thiodiazotropha taylori TaxID=2792791 RepID=A0A9E4KB46_9GAMM|nr:hypothetical protein [Candidatus Thiodiazotropha taylori]MCW4255976.1 hypothetical protein [Candidatus Thiodiazotropha taylori]